MHLYDMGKDHEETMCLISNVHLIAVYLTRVYMGVQTVDEFTLPPKNSGLQLVIKSG